ncbi:MAG: dolichyl-phosphate beta-glucosyltransferase [Planctomycetota bacterium]|jgi:dolichyl-phosphate beta-glucosyltransferase
MTDLSVVIPVFRGAAELLERLPAFTQFLDAQDLDYELIIVDDGSGDGSGELLKSATTEKIHVILNDENQGKFGAIATGMKAARGGCKLFTDGDLPYEDTVIPYMCDFILHGGFHVLVGDRTLPGSIYRGELGLVRGLATRIFTLFVRLMVTGGLHDTQCGIKAFRADVADAIFPLLKERGFAGDVELLYIALIHNLAIRRVPARLRHQGPSSVHPVRDGLKMLGSILQLRSRRSRGFYTSDELVEIASQDYWSHPR